MKTEYLSAGEAVEVLRNMRSVEDKLLETSLTKLQRGLLGQLRNQRVRLLRLEPIAKAIQIEESR